MTGMPLYSSIDAQTEFAIWALVGSPLIVASNVRDFKSSDLDILTNTEVIAVNQDPLGRPGDRVFKVRIHPSTSIRTHIYTHTTHIHAPHILHPQTIDSPLVRVPPTTASRSGRATWPTAPLL